MSSSSGRVLVVDDDVDMCNYLRLVLERRGFQVEHRMDAAKAFAMLAGADADVDVVVTDLHMHGMDGIDLCARIVANHADVPVIVLTAFGSLETAVAAIRAGAYDFITKPIDVQVLEHAVRRAIQHHSLREEVNRLRSTAGATRPFETMIGESRAMRALFSLLDQVSHVDSTVLVVGETGTGKELVARALHERSARASGPFVTVNCAAVPEPLLESELFGHVRGAFSGAVGDHQGLFRRADGGTLFLDEIGDMPSALQAKLLRALQDGRVRPIGGTEERAVDARIVAATHRDLDSMVEANEFRQDLLFRLNVITVEIPPLRARESDVLLLAQAEIERHAARIDKRVTGLTAAAAERLQAYSWPGNVRELRNVMERAVVLTTHERLIVEDLPPAIREYHSSSVALVPDANDPGQLPTLEEVQRRYVLRVLEAVGGNKSLAARTLGLERRTLYRMLERYGGERTGNGVDRPPEAND